MPATIVQSNSGGTGTTTPTSVTATLPAAATAGNTLLLLVSCDATATGPSGWTLDTSAVFNNGHYLWRLTAAGGETSAVITPGVAASTAWVFMEVSGLASSPLDVAAGNGQGSPEVTTWTTAAITPVAAADRFLVASWGSSNSVSAQVTFSGYTNSFVEVKQATTTKTSGTNVALSVASREVTSTSGSYSSTATYSDSSAPTGITAAYAVTGGTSVNVALTPGMAAANTPPDPTVTVGVDTAPAPGAVVAGLPPGPVVSGAASSVDLTLTPGAAVAADPPPPTVTVEVVVDLAQIGSATAGTPPGPTVTVEVIIGLVPGGLSAAPGPAPVVTSDVVGVTVGPAVDAATLGNPPAPTVTVGALRFTPPVRGRYVPPILPSTPPWQRDPMGHVTPYIPMPVNVFVLTDGTLTEQQPPLWDQVASVYYGGHTHPVTPGQAAALTAAGYTVDTVITT